MDFMPVMCIYIAVNKLHINYRLGSDKYEGYFTSVDLNLLLNVSL
jgi:hypothetical protein